MSKHGKGIDAAAACHLETALYAAAAGDTSRALGALMSIDKGSWIGIRERLRDPLTVALLGGQLTVLVEQLPEAARALLLGTPEPPAAPALAPRRALPAYAPPPPQVAAGEQERAGPGRAEPQVPAEDLSACFGGAAGSTEQDERVQEPAASPAA